MGDILKKMKGLLPTRRKLMQLYFALLFNADLKGFSTGTIYQGKSKQMCVPGLNCYSCPGAVGACPLGALQGALSADRSTLYYVGGILLLYGILFGRMVCGWLCPFGLIQDLLHKIPTPNLKKGPVTRILSGLKYILLVVFVFAIPLAYAVRDVPLPAFCKYICPAGTLEGSMTLLANRVNSGYFAMLGGIFTWKFLLTISILTGCVFIFRLFCRFLCPLGALYGLFDRFSIFGIQLDDSKCTACGRCEAVCKVDIRQVGDRECISCGECVAVCPTKAISWKGKKIFLRENEAAGKQKKSAAEIIAKQRKLQALPRTVAAVLMLAVLVFVLWSVHRSSPALPQECGGVGTLSVSYPLNILTAQGISSQAVDPGRTGKLTIVNFWGTWCTPCVQELPYFHQIAGEYPEVAVVAVHTYLAGDTAPAFIGQYYEGSPIIFALDAPLDASGLTGGYYSALGGRGTYPYTVILDENGVILTTIVSALQYEDLKALVEGYLP